MSNYSFVSIFALILAFYVSTGNADIECYECKHTSWGRPWDPHCMNLDSITNKATFSKSFFSDGWEGCLYIKKRYPDGAYLIERKGYAVPYPTVCEDLIKPGIRGSDCYFCFKDYCNDRDPFPPPPPTCPAPRTCPPLTTCPPPATCPTCPTPTTSSTQNMSLAQMEPIITFVNLSGVLELDY